MANELRSATFTISVNGQEKGSTIVSITKSVEQLEAVERELNATSATNTKVTKTQLATQKEANAVARLAIREYNKQQKANRVCDHRFKQPEQNACDVCCEATNIQRSIKSRCRPFIRRRVDTLRYS